MLKRQGTMQYLEENKDIDIQEKSKEQNNIYKPALKLFKTLQQFNTQEEIELISSLFLNIEFFKMACPSDISQIDFIKKCIPNFKYEFVPENQAVFHFGEIGDKFYIILKGIIGLYVPRDQGSIQEEQTKKILLHNQFQKLQPGINAAKIKQQINMRLGKKNEVIKQENYLQSYRKEYFTLTGVCKYVQIKNLFAGNSFGEISLTTDKPRGGSVIAQTNLHLVSLTKKDYKKIFEDQINLTKFKIQLFTKLLPDAQLFNIQKFTQYFKEFVYQNNTLIWSINEEVNSFFLISEGEVELFLPSQELLKTNNSTKLKTISLAILGSRNFVGEQDVLFHHKIRNFSCRTITKSRLLVILGKDYYQIRKYYSDIEKQLKTIIKNKQNWFQQRNLQITQGYQTIQEHINSNYYALKSQPYERVTVRDIQRLQDDSLKNYHSDQKFQQLDQKKVKFIRSRSLKKINISQQIEFKQEMEKSYRTSNLCKENFLTAFNQEGEKYRKLQQKSLFLKKNLAFNPQKIRGHSNKIQFLELFTNKIKKRHIKTQSDLQKKIKASQSLLKFSTLIENDNSHLLI